MPRARGPHRANPRQLRALLAEGAQLYDLKFRTDGDACRFLLDEVLNGRFPRAGMRTWTVYVSLRRRLDHIEVRCAKNITAEERQRHEEALPLLLSDIMDAIEARLPEGWTVRVTDDTTVNLCAPDYPTED